VIGFALAPFAGVSIIACLALGAIVATTDPVAVIAIFRTSRAVAPSSASSKARPAQRRGGDPLFAALLEWLLGGHHSAAATAVEFVRTLVGGVVIGLIGARVVVALLSWLRDLRPAQVTLTLALPYVVFIVGQYWLDVSGVVAAVTAGLVLSALGQPKIAPADWRFLHDLWEQLAFWASSLIFILASLMVPKLLLNVGWWDLISLLVLVAAALAGRAVVLWGLMPLLSGVGLSQRVDNKYKVVILWGGLRGAVTLAASPKRTDSARRQRFIAVLAGFVLFTLLVQG
jgi:CPA1 family monovalent cation:H+ antiporter